MYAFEFSRSQNEFTEFFSRFINYVRENTDMVATELSLISISNTAIAFASLGLTDSSDNGVFWDSVRRGASA